MGHCHRGEKMPTERIKMRIRKGDTVKVGIAGRAQGQTGEVCAPFPT